MDLLERGAMLRVEAKKILEEEVYEGERCGMGEDVWAD